MSLINANALSIPLAPGTVQCGVTSPPYYGLRSYGIGTENGEIGLEPTVEEYIAKMVLVGREMWRVLRNDGTWWLNLGDSYNGSGKGPAGITSQLGAVVDGAQAMNRMTMVDGLKPKDLIGIPWRVAFALQADGWYLRSDIIWHKPNPMPESVTDRPTKSHEYIFLLSKSPRYYYDAEAVRESGSGRSSGLKNYKYDGLPGHETKQGLLSVADVEWGEHNRRTVWTIPTAPYSGAHFATFPPDLVRPCVLAGSSPRACEICGAPWERVVEVERTNYKTFDHPHRTGGAIGGGVGKNFPDTKSTTTGWRPTCTCANEGTGKSIVLDPFSGSGTVVMVAQEYGRRGIGLELNPKYIDLALDRTAQARAQMVMPL